MLILFSACDPGMTIRQIKSEDNANSQSEPANPRVFVHVETTHPLIGETWYDPKITFTNFSDTPLTINSVELVTRFGTFKNKITLPAETYPIVVPVGRTVDVPVWFNLSYFVKETFEKPAEMQIHYFKNNQEFIARADIEGGSDETASP